MADICLSPCGLSMLVYLRPRIKPEDGQPHVHVAIHIGLSDEKPKIEFDLFLKLAPHALSVAELIDDELKEREPLTGTVAPMMKGDPECRYELRRNEREFALQLERGGTISKIRCATENEWFTKQSNIVFTYDTRGDFTVTYAE